MRAAFIIIITIVLFGYICKTHSATTTSEFLITNGMTIEFVDSLPSFTILPYNSSTLYLIFSFTSVSELNPNGQTVVTYTLPKSFSIIRQNIVQNETLLQNLTFYGELPNKTPIAFTYILASTVASTPQIAKIGPNTYYVGPAGYPLCFFDVYMGRWNFINDQNTLTANAAVSANVDGLSVGFSETNENFHVSLPYTSGTTLTAILSKLGLVDNQTTAIQNTFQITSISQPIGASVFITFPYFNNSIHYQSYIVVQLSDITVSLLSIIITVSIIVGLCIVGGIIGCFMCHQHKKIIAQQTEAKLSDSDDASVQKEKSKPKKFYNTLTTTVSIGNVFKMKM